MFKLIKHDYELLVLKTVVWNQMFCWWIKRGFFYHNETIARVGSKQRIGSLVSFI